MSVLMLKDKPVMELNDKNMAPVSCGKVLLPNSLPYMLRDSQTPDDLSKWLRTRKIPDDRDGISEVKSVFGKDIFSNHTELFASLNDGYWIMTRSQMWRKISFFSMPNFVPDIGYMFFCPWRQNERHVSWTTPDMTTGGKCKKTWVKVFGKPSLLKLDYTDKNNSSNNQTPLGEVLTSILCEKLDIPCVHSEFYVYQGHLCSKAENFVKDSEELVTLDKIADKESRRSGENYYEYCRRLFNKEGIKDGMDWLDRVIFVDNLTGNDNRRLSDIGFIRDTASGRFLRPAPLFDNGHCYYNMKLVNSPVKSLLFSESEADVVNRLKKQYDLRKLEDTEGIFKEMSRHPFITTEKKRSIIAESKNRIVRLTTELKL